MATAWFGPCPHCNTSLSYLHGVSGSSMSPKCPRCHAVVIVSRATFLMADHSRPAARPATTGTPKPAVVSTPIPDPGPKG